MKNTEVVTLVRGLFQEQETRFDQKLDDLKVNLRDEMRSCISASETKMIHKMNETPSDSPFVRGREIIDGITDILDESVFPQILELQTDMQRVKNHLQMV